jgi:hypothetical protein
MFKRSSANYSLWPEQARPRRGVPLTLAAGGFAVGVVCAIAAYNVISDFARPPAIQESVSRSAVEHVPVYAAAAPPAASLAPAPSEPAARSSRIRAPAAKVTLPAIGAQAAMPSAATDGRGSDALAGGPPTAAATPSFGNPPSIIREEASAAPPPVQQATAPEATKPEVSERPKHRKKVVRKKRERPSSYAAGYRQGPYYGNRGYPVYGGFPF